jgi:hypothetical protein
MNNSVKKDITRRQLSFLTGASAVGSLGSGVRAQTAATQSKVHDSVSVFQFMTESEVADVKAGTLFVDVTRAVQKALDSVVRHMGAYDIQLSSRGGTIKVPAGRYLVSDALRMHAGTCLIGEGPTISVLVNASTDKNVLTHIGADAGSVDQLLIENIGVVQKRGVASTAGSAIMIDGNGYGTSVIIRNVRTQDTGGGIYMASCFPNTLENVHAMRHRYYGFSTRFSCTSTTFLNCYAGAISGGHGFHLAGNYLSLVGCASDSNAGAGYSFYYDNGVSTSIAMMACGAEACHSGIVADRTAGLNITSPRVTVKAGGGPAIKLLGASSTTIVSPVLSCLAPNANEAIYQAANSGVSPASTSLVGMPSGFFNFASQFNDVENVFAICRASIHAGLWNDSFRLGDRSHFLFGLQKFQLGGAFPPGSGGVTYGQNCRLEATAAYKLAASVNYQPILNAPGATVAQLIAGGAVSSPSIKSGTVTRVEGYRINDMIGGSFNANLVLGNALALSNDWSLYNISSRPNLFNGPIQWGSAAGPSDTFGTGSPEGLVTGTVGSIYRRTDGGPNTTLYVKESGAGNKGWVAK